MPSIYRVKKKKKKVKVPALTGGTFQTEKKKKKKL